MAVDFGGACREIQIWVAPYYATGGVVAAAAVEANLLSAAWTGLPVLPLIIFAYLYYRGFVETAGEATQASN